MRRALDISELLYECDEWANKSEALTSYATQARDETLLNMAAKIKDRAI